MDTRDVNITPGSPGDVSEDVKSQPQMEESKEELESRAAQAGDKTDPNLLLKSLQEEREKRKLLEEEIQSLKSSTLSEEEEGAFSDEGKLLEKKISNLQSKLDAIEEEGNLAKIYSQYPILKAKAQEFMEFRKTEYPKATVVPKATKVSILAFLWRSADIVAW